MYPLSCDGVYGSGSPSGFIPDAEQPAWRDLPDDILQLIGSLFSEPQHVSSASLVCRGWQSGIRAGVAGLELDMNAAPEAWSARVAHLRRALPRLSRCTAHVSSSVSQRAFARNVQELGAQLDSIEDLTLRLSDGFDMHLASGAELGALRRLRSLTLAGGMFSGATAGRLLAGLAAACPLLEELRVLPEARCGLGNDEVPLLVQLGRLKTLEFQAYRLTSSGLRGLMALPHLERLSIHGLDADCIAADTACFCARPSLRVLHLGCDAALPQAVVRALADVPDLSMRFRWTDRVHGLLKTASVHLSGSLVRLDIGCCRLMDPGALAGLSALTGLTDLRMSVYSNADTAVCLHLSQLAPLSNLQVLHVVKQHAYFPEQRRFLESSIRIPVSADAAGALAAGCRRLASLRLCLSERDVAPEGLAHLTAFTALKSLCISADAFSGRCEPVAIDVLHLPHGLTELELRGMAVTTPGPALTAPGMPLGRLAALRLESCRLRCGQLQALAGALPQLTQLRMAHVAGLTDAGLASLSVLTDLVELSVLAQHNRAVTQSGMAALTPLRSLRYLTWQSDDLSAQGPVLDAVASFTILRLLSLSCTPATVQRACGGEQVLRQLLPYCHLDLIQ